MGFLDKVTTVGEWAGAVVVVLFIGVILLAFIFPGKKDNWDRTITKR